LLTTATTVLISLFTNSRLIYGMAEEKGLPKIFYLIDHRTKTPFVAIFFLALITIFLTFIKDLRTAASITNIFLFSTYALVNLSLIILRYKKPYIERRFISPLNIKKFNIIAFLGFISSLVLLYYVILGLF